MALEDFLGRTPEIRIIDFLAINYGNSYNQSEISEFTGVSRNILYKKLPEMVKKGILKVDNKIGRFKTYKLIKNNVTSNLVAAIMEYNMELAYKSDNDLMVDEKEIESPKLMMENRYYKAPDIKFEATPKKMPQIKYKLEKTRGEGASAQIDVSKIDYGETVIAA